MCNKFTWLISVTCLKRDELLAATDKQLYIIMNKYWFWRTCVYWLLNMLVSRVRAINDTGVVDVTTDVEWCCLSFCHQPLTSQRSSPIPSFSQHSDHRPPRSEEGPGWHFVQWLRMRPAFCLPEESSPPFPDCPSCGINNRLYFTMNENNDEIDPERRPNWQASQYLKPVPCSVSSNFPGTLANRHTSPYAVLPACSPQKWGLRERCGDEALDAAIPFLATGGA